jgi:hypothetical protein
MPGTSTVELLRGICAFEHARWSLFTSERDGYFLKQQLVSHLLKMARNGKQRIW